MKHRRLSGRPEWLTAEAARTIAAAAGAVPARRGSTEEAEAAVRAAAVGCLPSLPAPMLAEVAAAVTLAEAPPDQPETGVVEADADRLARRLGFLASGAKRPGSEAVGKLAARLAMVGAARIR